MASTVKRWSSQCATGCMQIMQHNWTGCMNLLTLLSQCFIAVAVNLYWNVKAMKSWSMQDTKDTGPILECTRLPWLWEGKCDIDVSITCKIQKWAIRIYSPVWLSVSRLSEYFWQHLSGVGTIFLYQWAEIKQLWRENQCKSRNKMIHVCGFIYISTYPLLSWELHRHTEIFFKVEEHC